MRVIKSLIEFQWDKGNIDENKKHNVANKEAEEVFFDDKRKIFKDKLHSGAEKRFIIVGKTKKARLLYLIFTQRSSKIRIISARDINRKEVFIYEKKVSSSKV